MSAAIVVPVTMTTEAVELIEELGLRRPLEEMIEHTRQTIGQLQSIEIEPWYEQDSNDQPPLPHLTVIGWRMGAPSEDDRVAEREWFEWCVKTYPPSVKQHVSFAVQRRG